jgi:hypothetical protein
MFAFAGAALTAALQFGAVEPPQAEHMAAVAASESTKLLVITRYLF